MPNRIDMRRPWQQQKLTAMCALPSGSAASSTTNNSTCTLKFSKCRCYCNLWICMVLYDFFAVMYYTHPRRLAKSNIPKQNFSLGVNVISEGSPSRIRMVRRISLGMTTRPRSSILRTIPVAFMYISPLAQFVFRDSICRLCQFMQGLQSHGESRLTAGFSDVRTIQVLLRPQKETKFLFFSALCTPRSPLHFVIRGFPLQTPTAACGLFLAFAPLRQIVLFPVRGLDISVFQHVDGGPAEVGNILSPESGPRADGSEPPLPYLPQRMPSCGVWVLPAS